MDAAVWDIYGVWSDDLELDLGLANNTPKVNNYK